MPIVARRANKSPVSAKPTLDVELVKQFIKARAAAKEQTEVRDSAKEKLKAVVETAGFIGGDGHRYLELPEKIGDVGALQLRKNESQPYLDLQVAEKLLRDRGCFDECTDEVYTLRLGDAEARTKIFNALKSAGVFDETVNTETVISDEKVYAFHQEHRDVLTAADLDAMTTTNITWAFWTVPQVGTE